MRDSFRVANDITGQDYEQFLHAASLRFPYFMLVWREQFHFKPSARAIRQQLKPLEVQHRLRTKWPGNIMYGHRGLVVTYRFEALGLEVLHRPASLFGWLQPEYPEDLAFFGKDRQCAFASVSHEREAWILDVEFGRGLPERFGLVQEDLDEKDWKDFYDHSA
jgi:hypothetical protein